MSTVISLSLSPLQHLVDEPMENVDLMLSPSAVAVVASVAIENRTQRWVRVHVCMEYQSRTPPWHGQWHSGNRKEWDDSQSAGISALPLDFCTHTHTLAQGHDRPKSWTVKECYCYCWWSSSSSPPPNEQSPLRLFQTDRQTESQLEHSVPVTECLRSRDEEGLPEHWHHWP